MPVAQPVAMVADIQKEMENLENLELCYDPRCKERESDRQV